MERIIDDTIEQTRTRHAFGAPLLNNQVIAFRLAELKTEVEAVKSLLYRATREYILVHLLYDCYTCMLLVSVRVHV